MNSKNNKRHFKKNQKPKPIKNDKLSFREREQVQVAYKKKRIIAAMRKSFGNVSFACEQIGINRSTYYKYYNKDPTFREAIWEIEEEDLDYTESKLKQLIDEKEPSDIYFKLKCKGKKRGYIERNDIGVGTISGEPQKIIIGGKEIVFS